MSASEKIEVDPSSFPLDRYEPESLLGQGAVGDVYKCYDRVLKKTVAVKCLRFLDSAQLLSFQNEARLLSSLHYHSIVKILDFGTTHGSSPYMVMEFVDGITLEQLVKENGPLTEEKALGITLAVCDALSYLHRNLCFHRDLKPANIVIANDSSLSSDSSQQSSEVRLIDFGLADVKNQLQEPTIVHGRTIVGTPAFMSPDQMNGEKFDSASEVYSLGGVLFYALTGEAPFRGDTPMEIFSRQMNSDPPALSDVYPDGRFSQGLEEIVARCLSRERKTRFQTIEQVKQALSGLTDRLPESLETEAEDDATTAPSLLSNRTVVVSVAICSLIMASLVFSYFLVTPKAVRNQNLAMLKSKVLKSKYRFDRQNNILRSDGKPLFLRAAKRAGIRYASATSHVVDADLKSLRDAPAFDTLDISRTEVKGDGLKYVVPLPIKTLEVADLLLTNKGFDYICQMPQLRKIDLGCVPISGERIRKLVATLKDLEVLVIDQCNITDDDLKTVLGLKNLKAICLQNSKVTYKGLRQLSSLKELNSIQLSGSLITDDDLKKMRLEDFPALVSLDIHSCPHITSKVAQEIEEKHPGLALHYSFSVKDPSTAKMVDLLGDSADDGK